MSFFLGNVNVVLTFEIWKVSDVLYLSFQMCDEYTDVWDH